MRQFIGEKKHFMRHATSVLFLFSISSVFLLFFFTSNEIMHKCLGILMHAEGKTPFKLQFSPIICFINVFTTQTLAMASKTTTTAISRSNDKRKTSLYSGAPPLFGPFFSLNATARKTTISFVCVLQ